MNIQFQLTAESRACAPDSIELDSWRRPRCLRLLALLGYAALAAGAGSAWAQSVPLGTASPFGVLAASAITNTGPSIVTGDLGISPNNASSVTGFPPGQVIGTTHFADAVAAQAQLDVTTAYNALAGMACGTVVTADLGGTTLTPGVYCAASTMGITGTLTLDAQNDPNALFVFQVGSTLTTGSASQVVVINGGSDCNVYWQIGSSATLGTGTNFVGNILALASITLTTGANSSGRLLARNGAVTLDGSSATACAAPAVQPSLFKAFNPILINAGGVSTLTITMSNPNPGEAMLTSALVDTLPNGVVVANLPNVSTTCGGSGAPIANAGGSTVTLPAGRSIPANGSCTLIVDVTAALSGVYINTLAADSLVTSNGNNPSPAVATLTVNAVLQAMTLVKAFNPSSINANGVSTLTVTLGNPNPTMATLSNALVDTLPNGVVVAMLPNVNTNCGGAGSPLALAGGLSVTLPAGRSIPANGSCTLQVDVTAALPGIYVNTLPAGALVTSNGNNPSPAVATLTVNVVLQAMTLVKAFNPSSINANGVSTLTITLGNPNPTIATLTSALVDTLPNGVVVAMLPNVTTNCGGAGSPLALAGGLSVTLPAGRTIPANGQCTLNVDVTAALAGTYVNTLVAGALVTSNGNNPLPAMATLTVIAVLQQPTLSKSFNPSTINEGGISTLTITLSNPNASIATLTAPLVDTLPNGVLVAPLPNVGTTCGGVGAPVALSGAFTVTLPAGRTIPANGSCTLAVDVTAALAGSYVNTLVAGALITSNGNNPSPAIATLTVVGLVPPPTLGKGFNPSTINENGVSTLTITLSNPNPAIATLTSALVDTLPNGVVVAALPNVSTTCGGAGAPVALAGGSTVTLPAGRTIPANGSCTLSVDVTAALAGTYLNTLVAGALVTSNGNNPLPAVATLVVIGPGPSAPTISKSFTPSTINAGDFSTLTITLSNPNPTIATLLEPLIDTLPNGVLVAAIPNLHTTCGGTGELIAITGSWTITVPAGRTIPANSSCIVTVDVTAALGGTYVNIIVAGALVTSNGNNPAPAIATLTVITAVPPPTLVKSFSPSTIEVGGVSTLTITLSNSSSQLATLTAPLVDTLPAGVIIAAIPNVGSTCNGGGAPLAFAGESTLTLPAGNSIPANGSCAINVDVTAGAVGSYVNILVTGALVTTIGSNLAPAIATLNVIDIAPPTPTINVINVPTLSTLSLLMLAASMILIGLLAVRLHSR